MEYPSMEGQDGLVYYEIRIRGHLDAKWAEWFENMEFSLESDGTTILAGPVADQAELHGLLRQVRDLGLPLVSVIQILPNRRKEHTS